MSATAVCCQLSGVAVRVNNSPEPSTGTCTPGGLVPHHRGGTPHLHHLFALHPSFLPIFPLPGDTLPLEMKGEEQEHLLLQELLGLFLLTSYSVGLR